DSDNGNLISENRFSTNGSIAIDLVVLGGSNDGGDGISINDGTTVGTTGNIGFDFPVIDTAALSGGNLTVTGWARPGAQIQFYEAAGLADDQNSGGTAHGEGIEWLFTETEGSGSDADGSPGSYANPDFGSDAAAARFSFTVPTPVGLIVGDEISAIATDGANNTSEFGVNATVAAAQDISGVVFQDLVGDVLNDGIIGSPANAGVPGFTVRLYRDTNTNGVPDGGDALVSTQVTGAGGAYSFTGLAPATYYVAVDSTSFLPVWPEQSYGPASSWDGSGFSGAAGPFYGGAGGAVSDAPATLPGSEHVARAIVAGAGVTNIDFGFSI
ncbi:MAG: hypothetical protein GY778_04425, partial [bacterium]|nr:hypothetical protein [bacterium]